MEGLQVLFSEIGLETSSLHRMKISPSLNSLIYKSMLKLRITNYHDCQEDNKASLSIYVITYEEEGERIFSPVL